jgi:uncharacterized protein
MLTQTAYVSRPTILIGNRINAALSNDLLSVLVEETTEGLFRCEAHFNNLGSGSNQEGQYLYFGRDPLDFGANFAVRLPTNETAREIFQGRISAIEAEYSPDGSASITVLAEDRLQDLRMTRRTRTFEDISDDAIIRQIAQEHSLTPEVDLQGPTHKIIAQVNQSDLAFLRERVRCADAELWVQDTTLYAQRRANRASADIRLTYGANLFTFSARADLAHQRTEVGVSGWDVTSKDAIDAISSASAINAELDAGHSGGGTILQQAFGERKEYIVHMVPLTGEEAQSLANARYRERARRFVTGSGVADGDARIRAGCALQLSGLGRLFDGKYYVTRVRHSYDGMHGYRSTIDVERPGIGQV